MNRTRREMLQNAAAWTLVVVVGVTFAALVVYLFILAG
jgi:hypothetical protein